MKHFYLVLVFLTYCNVDLFSQTIQVLEDDTSIFCASSFIPGIASDTMFVCQASVNGSSLVNGNCVTYVPNTNYFGYDSVCITSCFGALCFDTVLHITINPLSDRIVQNTQEDATVFICESVISGGSDVTISGCSLPLFGSDLYNPSCVIYTPANDFIGLDSFCIVSCVDTLCDTSTLVINMIPVTETVTVNVPGNGAITLCVADVLTAADTLASFSLSCGPINNNGVVSMNSANQCLTFTPDSAAFDGTLMAGTDQICITVCNSAGVCDITNFAINIESFKVVNSVNATLLAESLAGAGVEITGASFNCNGQASGYYSNPPTALGLEDGIVLSSGRAIDAAGPTPGVISGPFGTMGEVDLEAALASLGETYSVFDACVLEFDIDVLGDSLSFNYVMGSEEYNTFVCGSVNDIFGFFVTGQNPIGANYVSQNVALIPGGTTPVSINTVNNGFVGAFGGGANTCILTNSGYFNGVVPGVSYGGNTVAMQAKIRTTPCTTYHFKLAIGDGGDDVYDSGVFLESGSFKSLPVTLASSTILGEGFVNAVEGCVDGVFSFELDAPLTTDYGVKFQIGGSAVNGVDYNLIEDSITFLAGATTVDVNIVPITDALTEGDETVKLLLLNPCTNLPFDSAELTIIDLIPFNLMTIPDTVCANDTAVLHATIAGDDDALAVYSWSANIGNVLDVDSGYTEVVPAVSTEYYVEYTLGTCTKMDTTFIFVPTFNRTIDTSLISCPGANDGGFSVATFNPIGNVSYSWSPVISTDTFIANLGPDTFYVSVMDESGLVCGTIIDTLILEEPLGLTFDFDLSHITCKDAADGILLISDVTDTTNFEIEITFEGVTLPVQNYTSDLNGEFVLNNLAPGLYDSIRITNMVSGCFAVLSFTLTEPDTLEATIFTPGVVLCAGGVIDSLAVAVIGGTEDYHYLWSTGDTSETITGVGIGMYWVEVSDSNFCTAQDSFEIMTPTPLYFSLLADSTRCFNEANGMAYVDSVSGGIAPYSYQWDALAGNQVTDTAFNLAAGVYVLTLSDFNDCPKLDTVTVYDAIQIIVSETHTNISCVGETDGAIDVTVSGGAAGYTYAWTGPNTFTASTKDLTDLEAGTYNLTVTDTLGCTATVSVVIIEPAILQVDFSPTAVSCFDGADGSLAVAIVSGGVAPFMYQWGATTNNQVGTTANGLSAGTYTVSVTDDNGCVSVFSDSVSQPEAPLSLTMDGVDLTCASANDGSVSVVVAGGTPGYTYLWNDPQGQTNTQAIGLDANTYQVTVTDNNGCVARDTVSISQPESINVFMLADSANCWGQASGALNISATGGTGIGYAYSIDGGETFQNENDFFNLPAGVYTEIVVLDLGSSDECLSDVYTTTVFEQAYFSFLVEPNDTTLQLEESVELSLVVTSPAYTETDIASVNWYPTSGLNCTDCANPTVLTYDHYTEYIATVNYLGGDGVLCVANSNTIIMVENNLELFIPNAFTPGNFDETNNIFEVYGEGIEFVKMQIYNRWGEKVFESANQRVYWDGTFKGEMQKPGVYSYYVHVEYLDRATIERKGSVSLIR